MDEKLLQRVLLGCAPLLIWAGHFAALYLLAAVHASPWLLLALSALAIGGCAMLLMRALPMLRQSEVSLDGWAMALNAVIGLIGIAWGTLALLLLLASGRAA